MKIHCLIARTEHSITLQMYLTVTSHCYYWFSLADNAEEYGTNTIGNGTRVEHLISLCQNSTQGTVMHSITYDRVSPMYVDQGKNM